MAVLTHNMNEDGTNNLNIDAKQHLYGKIIHVTDMYDKIITNKYFIKYESKSRN